MHYSAQKNYTKEDFKLHRLYDFQIASGQSYILEILFWRCYSFFFFFRVLHTIFGDSVICHHGTTKEYYFYLLILVKTLINRIVHGVVHVFSGATLIFI